MQKSAFLLTDSDGGDCDAVRLCDNHENEERTMFENLKPVLLGMRHQNKAVTKGA